MKRQLLYHAILLLLAIWWLQGVAAAQTIHDAAIQGNLALARRILAADPGQANLVGVDGNTPLHEAAWNGHAAMVTLLIAAGGHLNVHRLSDGFTPLFCATYQGHADCAQILIDHGAVVDARDKIGNTPLAFAVADGHFDVARVLIAAGADVNARREPQDGWTALFSSVGHGRVDTSQLLLQHGADPEIMSDDGNKAIDIAARYGTINTLALLIDYGQSVDTLDRDGNTPLAVAARNGQTAMVKFLIGAGADINHKNKAGQTAGEIALQNGKSDIAEVIAQYQNALDERATRDAIRKSSGIVIRSGYQNWVEPTMQAKVIYNNDFASGKVGPEWSTSPLPGAQQAPLRVSVTPIGSRHFLGDFGSQAVRLTLKNLPLHKEVSLDFDLYIIRSWDGNNLNAGPDVFNLSVVDGPTLLHTTFGNSWPGLTRNIKIQAYPGEYPGDHYGVQFGAVETNTLGYTMTLDGQVVPIDSVYKLSYTFPHSGTALLLDFAAIGLEPLDNESWGLTNVQVSVAVPAPPPVHRVVAIRSAHLVERPVRAMMRRPIPRLHPAAHRAVTKHNTKTASAKRSGVAAKRLHPKEKPPAP